MSELPEGCEPRCWVCPHREWTAEQSLAQKHRFLSGKLAPWVDRLEPVRSGPRWRYRDRAWLRAWRESGQWALGFIRREGEPDEERVAIPSCPAQTEALNAKLARVRERLPADLPLAWVHANGEWLSLVVHGAVKDASMRARELGACDWAGTGFRGVWLNQHPTIGDRKTSSRGWAQIWGAAGDPSEFAQLIAALWEESIDRSVAFFREGGISCVADLYSGSGATVRRWKSEGWETLGVELVPSSEPEVLRGRAAERLPQLREFVGGVKRWAAYLNPSRLGLEPEVRDWLAGSSCSRVAYLSCSAGTLARDLGDLVAGGFRVKSMTPYDFFPQTEHVETLVLLEMKTDPK